MPPCTFLSELRVAGIFASRRCSRWLGGLRGVPLLFAGSSPPGVLLSLDRETGSQPDLG